MNGLVEGVKTALKMAPVGLGMVRTKRMNPFEAAGGHKVRDLDGFPPGCSGRRRSSKPRASKAGRIAAKDQ